MIASVGEIRISWLGVWFQIAGLFFEAMRLVMIQVLLSDDGEKMDPLLSLYYYAPICGAMNIVTVYMTELDTFQMADFVRVGPSILLLNAMVAFGLNVASVFLVGDYLVVKGNRIANMDTDREDKQPCHDIIWDIQEHPSCRDRRVDMGYSDRTTAVVWIHCRPLGSLPLLCTFGQNRGILHIYEATVRPLDVRQRNFNFLNRGQGHQNKP